MKFEAPRLSFRLVAAAVVVMPGLPRLQAQEIGQTLFHRYSVVAPTVTKAGKEVDAQRFDQARLLLEPVLKEIPGHVGAHFLLARMAYESRDFASALRHIEISERSLKDLQQRYAKLMEDKRAKDESDATNTKQSLQNLRDAGYDSIDDILVAGEQHLSQLEDEKRGLFRQDASFAVPSVYSLLHGNCLFRLGRIPEAEAQYALATHADPTSAKAWNNLIAVRMEMKLFGQAREALTQAEAAGVTIQPKLKQSVLEAK